MLFGCAASERNASASGRFSGLGTIALLAALLSAAPARAEPPIKSPQDAFCRAEAKARVFVTPDPANLGLHEIGRRIYFACMQRLSPGSSRRPGRHGRRHRRR